MEHQENLEEELRLARKAISKLTHKLMNRETRDQQRSLVMGALHKLIRSERIRTCAGSLRKLADDLEALGRALEAAYDGEDSGGE